EVQYSPKGKNQWSAGADGYSVIDAQTVGGSGVPDAYVYNGVSYTVTRIDRIVLDPASGVASLLCGTPFRNNIDEGAPIPPEIPAGFLMAARIERCSVDAVVIPSDRITDERDISLVGTAFQASGDFLVTAFAQPDTVSVDAGGLQFIAVEISGKQSEAIRKSVSFRVPKDQYDVRVKRITADSVDDDVFDETAWTALRTIRYVHPVAMTGLAVTVLRIKATDQLNGVIDRFNGVVHSIFPDWNGSAWVEQVTSNPASIFRHVLQGGANARPLADSRIDFDKIEDWHDSCADAEREFNTVIDYNVSVREVLQDVAAAGRASPTLIDGKWAVVEDKLQTVPLQHFTPRNTFKFKGEKAFDERPDALRIRYINREDGWMQDERLVFDDGFSADTATKYETLELMGVTSPEQAWKDGRYHIATARLRPETYSFYADIEHIVCTRGDLIRFTHDVPMFGLMSARVKSVSIDNDTITAVTLDADVTMMTDTNYVVRFRKADGSSPVISVVTNVGTTSILTFTTPCVVEVGPEVGDLVLFGESGQESVELIVKSIEPVSDLSARITCVDAAPGVYDADQGTIPAYSSQISVPPELKRPPEPIVVGIQTGDEVLIRNPDGSFTSTITVTLAPYDFPFPLSVGVRIKASSETDLRPAIFVYENGMIRILDVEAGEYYDISIFYKTNVGLISSPTILNNQLVTGATGIPNDVENFSVTMQGQQANLSWDAVADIDLSHYRLKWSPATSGATWASSIDLVPKISAPMTSKSVPALTGTYLIRAVDYGGRESAIDAIVISTIAEVEGFNAVTTQTEDPTFGGTKNNVEVSSGSLRISSGEMIDDWVFVDDIINFDIGTTGGAIAGTYYFSSAIDLTGVFISRVTAGFDLVGDNLTDLFDSTDMFDSEEDFDGSVDPSSYSAYLQLRTTEDDPAGSPAWSGWKKFVVGDYTARAYEFRIVLSSASAFVTPVISELSVVVDMPDRIESQRHLASDAAGSAITFTNAFWATPAIGITGSDLATGDYFAITSQSVTGFSIRFFNSTGTGISRHFDYLAKGYGKT
ncbi:MAG: hypothetical protein KAI61_03090, partial [Alphaproteobacteria bacterium]|nr:hypothetical protein [Alphaproteobacteria bacterium]